jgi:hypothetical protein
VNEILGVVAGVMVGGDVAEALAAIVSGIAGLFDLAAS